jgi:hypothetical protein
MTAERGNHERCGTRLYVERERDATHQEEADEERERESTYTAQEISNT